VIRNRVSAALAAGCYEELQESRVEREKVRALQALARSTAPPEKPNSQQRAAIRRVKEGR
jgi:hypothetical protein